MNELIKKRLTNGTTIKVFMKNNFYFNGKVTGVDETFLEILDSKTRSYRIIELNEISNIELMNDEHPNTSTGKPK